VQLLGAFDELQHSAEEILRSIPTLNREAIETMHEIIQDAESLALRSREMLENEMGSNWDSKPCRDVSRSLKLNYL
jgi:hypothetical protein